jgi:hypothetical protein
MPYRSWWERLVAPEPKSALRCKVCNAEYQSFQLLCAADSCSATLPVQEIGESGAKVWVALYRLLMVGVGIGSGYLALAWPGYFFAAVTFFGFGYLLLRHYPEALRVCMMTVIVVTAVDWGLRTTLLTSTYLTLIKNYTGMAAGLFVLFCGLAHIFSESESSSIKTVEAAFLVFFLTFLLDTFGAFKLPGVDPGVANYWQGRVLFASLSFGLAVLSIEAVVYTVRQPPFTIPNLIKRIPTIPPRILPRLEMPGAAGGIAPRPFVKSAIALVNSILRSLENFYNRALRSVVNAMIRFPIQVINYVWRKLVALILHLARSVKRFSEQLVKTLWNLAQFLYHFSRVILLPIALILLIYQQAWRLSDIIFNYIQHGGVALIWSGLVAALFSFVYVFASVWVLTRSNFMSLLVAVGNGLLDFGQKLILLFAIVSWMFIAASHYLAPSPYRVGPLTIVASIYLLSLLVMALFLGKLTAKKAGA